MEVLLARCLLDLETHPGNAEILKIGALFCEQTWLRQGRFQLDAALTALDRFAAKADFVLGHNLLYHDLPLLRATAPRLRLLDKPVIDTLLLSPLAFPHNPYHHLVKNYKLVRDTVNDPVADARLAAQLFAEECRAFAAMKTNGEGDLVAFYRFCLAADQPGLDAVFEALGIPQIKATTAAALLKQRKYADRVCRNALPTLLQEVQNSSLQANERAALAYAVAWLSVADGNSVLPPWVRHSFPAVLNILHRLREVDCGDADCAYCRANHDAVRHLQNFFAYPAYRSKPAAADGSSLQQQIVEAGMRQQPLLAILPTGGGKSLCYQVPALVRYRRRGLLTVVISPLQALMKDQVEGLIKRTGTPFAYALYGLLTPPERHDVLEKVRLGDAAILYVSPEQLRNKSFRDALAQREVGCWVFDEAHCLSKWGHDFRPDYLYAGRFVREFAHEQKQPVPPVACFTATAKQDVMEEIRAYFLRELQQDLTLFEGGVERDNLNFEVQLVGGHEKHSRIAQLLGGLPSDGCAVVYTATRKHSEEVAEFLLNQEQPLQAAAFHAGLDAPQKQAIQDAFSSGEMPIICATNAFGMGIDKDNVRLVIHADIPGSLENYLQEAGRAGRDQQEAHCILLYDERDIETQFKLNALSQLSRRDIAQILRALRRARRKDNDTVVLTSQEILRDEDLTVSFESDESSADTKVKTAVAWLERAGFVERNLNQTNVFQGQPLLTLEEAKHKIRHLKLSNSVAEVWLRLFAVLLDADLREGMSADDLATQARISATPEQTISPARQVIRHLNDMAAQGLISQGMHLTAFVKTSGPQRAEKIFPKICQLEVAMLALMREQEPDAAQLSWLDLSLRELEQGLRERGYNSHPETLRKLLKNLADDGRGMAGSRGSLDLRYMQQNYYRVRLQRDWDALQITAERRRAAAKVIIDLLLQKAGSHKGEVLVFFTYDELIHALRQDLSLGPQLKDPQAAVERGLLFLHEQRALHLQQGLAVFRQAMSIDILPSSKGRRYAKGDYEALEHHYLERIIQVHVMNEYARLGMAKISEALTLVAAYFSLERKQFLEKYFLQRRDMLYRATSAESYRAIVDCLGNPAQMRIVAADADENSLVLAGPGSGKTRVVVHRCAYLLRVKRVSPRSILVICFNRYAALELRQRLRDLVGDDARGVAVHTYHGLALRLCGVLPDGNNGGPDFARLIVEATRWLRDECEIPGLEADELRERLLAGYRYILVDEYQDIDQAQYDFISAIAGRTAQDAETKLSLLAVGDDDQNIYGFRGANIAFIRRFEEDYQAKRYYLTENYRSSAHIIEAANSLIACNQQRMKSEHAIQINKQRRQDPPGGSWQQRDPLGQGRVQIFSVQNDAQQAQAVVDELLRLNRLDAAWEWHDCAIFAQRWDTLIPIRALCEYQRIPLQWGRDSDSSLSLSRIREIALFLEQLKKRTGEYLGTASLRELAGQGNSWHKLLHSLLDSWELDVGTAPQAVGTVREYIYDALRESARQRGDGVLLTTIHRAKGLEFKHVFLLDEAPLTHGDAEAQRRLLYVGMTRAQQTLHVFRLDKGGNPHWDALQGELYYRDAPAVPAVATEQLRMRFELLQLSDIFINYAGQFAAEHPLHQALTALAVDDFLYLQARNNKLYLLNKDGQAVAQLSRQAQQRWQPRLQAIVSIQVLALYRRLAEDSEPEWRKGLRSERWEVPLCEIKWRDE